MPVTLINTFIVPPSVEEEFLANWRRTSSVFFSKSGAIEAHLHRNAGIGDSTYRFTNLALWESAQAWSSNHTAYRPTEYDIEGVKGHPAIYESAVDLYGKNTNRGRHGTPRVTVINTIALPENAQEDFIAEWKGSSQQLIAAAGFIESHLQYNTGVGNPTFGFVDIARWDSADAWRAHVDQAEPISSAPGTKVHSAIFDCVLDLVGLEPLAAGSPSPFPPGFFAPARNIGQLA